MMYLALKYALFAGIATLANIGSQYAFLAVCDNPLCLYPAMACGTLAGLMIKYVLDKRFIFYHRTETAREDLFKFVVYSLMGVFTTLIFWGTEILFHHLFVFPQAKYLGAVIGLTVGYVTKYHLDKRFVFRNWKEAGAKRVSP
ncbi:MAG: GtrA family protein [Chrysiogenales bacterium]|nr:MAG: GtrA family protein [Chrysiogenales bacterium]